VTDLGGDGVMADRPVLRSRLYIPGVRASWLAKAVQCGVDAVIFDLDDAVSASEKESAREDVATAIFENDTGMPIFVRINDLTSRWALDDLESVVRPGLFGIVVPRVVDPSQIVSLDFLLSWLELRADMPDGTVVLSPIFETAAALHFAYEIVAASRRVEYVGAIATDGGDVEREIGYRWSASAWESVSLRARGLVDVRAAGAKHPLTGIWTSLSDPEGLRAFTEQGRDLGYEGIDVIHPSHVAMVHDVFAISEARILEAEKIVGLAVRGFDGRALNDEDIRNLGAVRFEGRMVDAAMVRTAAELLRQARKQL
jgi:citrate lyase subunit beta/citryl-CoA lyase